MVRWIMPELEATAPPIPVRCYRVVPALLVSLRRAFSPTFPAGEMVFFIPWRVVAEESGAAH